MKKELTECNNLGCLIDFIYRFRFAECQLEALRKCRTLRHVKIALSQLPKTLDETYDRILNCIEEEDRLVAHRTLQLLVFTCRPLTIAELVETIAVNCEKEMIDSDSRLLDPYDILEICSSLVELSMYVFKQYARSDMV